MPASHAIIMATVIVCVAALIHGYGGFGFGITCMTLFAATSCDLERMSVIVTIWAGAIIFSLLVMSWKDAPVDWKRLVLILCGVILGQPLGYWFIRTFTDHPVLRLTFGIILLIFAINGVRVQHRVRKLPTWLAVPVGGVSGFVAGAFVSGGPPVIMYLYSQVKDPRTMKTTVQALFCCGIVVRLSLVSIVGRGYSADILILAACTVPLAFFCAKIGHVLSKKVSVNQFKRYVYALIGILAVMIIIKATLSWTTSTV